jgi:hypothetical protein
MGLTEKLHRNIISRIVGEIQRQQSINSNDSIELNIISISFLIRQNVLINKANTDLNGR